MVSTQPNADGSSKEPPVPAYPQSRKISLILPCFWANPDLEIMTARCLTSIADYKGKIEKILVNDGSPSYGKISVLHPLYSSGRVDKRIDLKDNGGYSKACNVGLKSATGDILIVGNNDLIFPKNWLTELLMPLDMGYDIATCWTSDQDNVKLEDRIEDGSKFGSLFVMRREVYEQLGGFDEQFKGYFSDLDYRRRALDAGFIIGKNLNLVVEHIAKATYKLTDPSDSEYLRAMRLYEAKWGSLE